MPDNKMLQAILDKVTTVDSRVTSMEKQMKEGFGGINERLDKIGKSVAYLEAESSFKSDNVNQGYAIAGYIGE